MFEISKMYDIGIKKYRDYKFRVCCKDSIPLISLIIRSASIRTFYDHSVTVKYKWNVTNLLKNNFIWWFFFHSETKKIPFNIYQINWKWKIIFCFLLNRWINLEVFWLIKEVFQVLTNLYGLFVFLYPK